LVATWDMLMRENFAYMNLQTWRSRMRLQALCAACATPRRDRNRHLESRRQSKLPPSAKEAKTWRDFAAKLTMRAKPAKRSPSRRVRATTKMTRVLTSQTDNNLLACDTCHFREIGESVAIISISLFESCLAKGADRLLGMSGSVFLMK